MFTLFSVIVKPSIRLYSSSKYIVQNSLSKAWRCSTIQQLLPVVECHTRISDMLVYACTSCESFYISLTAPFTRTLTSKLGSRLVTILGSIVATLGLILCSVAPTIHYYYAFFGLLVGK
mgnify:CR=1 FL=1